jgi:hypothetical protein
LLRTEVSTILVTKNNVCTHVDIKGSNSILPASTVTDIVQESGKPSVDELMTSFELHKTSGSFNLRQLIGLYNFL